MPEITSANDAPANPSATVTAFPTTFAPPPKPLPRMGDTVLVQIKPGALLRNNETGGFFAEGTPTPQTTTVTLLRRLMDGDLVLV